MARMRDFFDIAEVVNILHGFNPWWTGRASTVPEFRRLAFGACRAYLDNPELRRAILLSGPRRVGKTTLLQQLAASQIKEGVDPKSILYVSLDHPLFKLVALRDLLRLYHQEIHPEGSPALLLLDEVQYSRGWETEVKLLVDHGPAYTLPFEIKCREQAPLEAAGGLAAYCAGENVRQAYLVTKRDDDFGPARVDGIGTQFLKVPAHVLCYLLGQAERLLWQPKAPA